MYLKWKSFIPLFLILTLISGCFGGEKPLIQKLEEKAEGKIKVFHAYDEQYFNERYGKLFSVKYPNIEFEVISGREIDTETIGWGSEKHKQEIKNLIDKHKPDVMVVNQSLFTEYAQNGKLYNLDTLIEQDKSDVAGYMDGYMDGYIEMIRNLGNGSIFGLSPKVSPEVLFYNANLFKEHGIEPPHHKMTWRDVFELANRFANIGTGEKKIYGFDKFSGEAPDLLDQVASTSGLSKLDSKGEKLLLSGDGWKKAIQLVTDTLRNKATTYVVKVANDSGYIGDNRFLKGDAAMIVGGTWLIGEMKGKDFDWGMVTAPIDSASSNESTSVDMMDFFAIAADTPNLSVAWEFVEFINSPERAKFDSRSIGYGGVPTRNQYLKEIDGKNTDAFYLLKPKVDERTDTNIPDEFREPYSKLLNELLQAIIDNKKTVDEGVAELQQKGQEALIKARVEEKARKEKEQAQKKAS